MKTTQNVAFVLENGQEIWFHSEDLLEFELVSGPEVVSKIGEEIVSIPMLGYMTATIDAKANHTYPTQYFATPSQNTNFEELIAASDIGFLVLEGDSDPSLYCVADGSIIRGELDKFGNLTLEIDSNPVAPIEPPELPF